MAGSVQAVSQAIDKQITVGETSELFIADAASLRSTRATSLAFADLGEDEADFVVPAKQRQCEQKSSALTEQDSRVVPSVALESADAEAEEEDEEEISNTNPSGKFFENAGHPDDNAAAAQKA
eukprot:1754462-Amphidinium_carterae.2